MDDHNEYDRKDYGNPAGSGRTGVPDSNPHEGEYDGPVRMRDPRRPGSPSPKILAAAVIGVTALLLALLLFLVLRPAQAEEPPTVSGSATASEAATTHPQTSMLCILGEWEGKLAVFSPNGISPDEVYDVYISTLPEEEQRKLEEGIAVYDEQTLAGLLEDYTS